MGALVALAGWIFVFATTDVRVIAFGVAAQMSFSSRSSPETGSAANPSPGQILDDRRLTPTLLQLIAERAHEDVAGAARAIGGDDAHGLAWIGLRRRRRRAEGRAEDRENDQQRERCGPECGGARLIVNSALYRP